MPEAIAPTPPARALPRDRFAILLLAALAALVAWDATGADMTLAGAFADAGGFRWRNHWLFATVLHAGGRIACWAIVAWIAVSIGWPTGSLRLLPRRNRVWLLGTVVVSVVAVSLLKQGSSTSCPWDIDAFGGIARHVSHWRWMAGDGGPGRCFPAGHASGAFALVAGYFAFRWVAPRTALHWLVGALAFGAVLGIGQQVRGAHFASHTLWTAWICCAVAWASATLVLRRPKGP